MPNLCVATLALASYKLAGSFPIVSIAYYFTSCWNAPYKVQQTALSQSFEGAEGEVCE